MQQMKATLILESGAVFQGVSMGASADRVCEMVFNTSMTGYQEILTDPSYAGQGIVMSYPLIGINLSRQGCCIANFYCNMTFKLWLKWRNINNNPTSCISRFTKTDSQHIPRDSKILHRTR